MLLPSDHFLCPLPAAFSVFVAFPLGTSFTPHDRLVNGSAFRCSPAKIQGASGVALLSERIGGGQRGWVWVCSLLMEVVVFACLMSFREEESCRVPVSKVNGPV